MVASGAQLVQRMQDHRPPRDVYLTNTGHYALLYGGGRVQRKAIEEALQAGWIKPKWDDRPDLEYWRLSI